MKKQIVLIIVFLFFLTPPAQSEEPFSIDLKYPYPGGILQIDITRNSLDEIKYPLQKLVVFRDRDEKLEENLINQNHLHQITKLIPYFAELNDTIYVQLFYGDSKILTKNIVVGGLTEELG